MKGKTMARRTVNVADVKAAANQYLADSVPEFAEQRQGMAHLLERILHDTGNYAGFRYLSSELVEETGVLREGYDATRIEYY